MAKLHKDVQNKKLKLDNNINQLTNSLAVGTLKLVTNIIKIITTIPKILAKNPLGRIFILVSAASYLPKIDTPQLSQQCIVTFKPGLAGELTNHGNIAITHEANEFCSQILGTKTQNGDYKYRIAANINGKECASVIKFASQPGMGIANIAREKLLGSNNCVGGIKIHGNMARAYLAPKDTVAEGRA